MNLRQLQQFVALVETANFHRAAEMLHMAQPPLSVSIRRLEEELGGKLFVRTSSGVVPTPLALTMLTDARAALFHAQQCKLKAQEALVGLGGMLRVGFIGTATYQLLPRLIPELRSHFPQAEMELMEMTSLEILEGLRARTLDLGFLRFPVLDSMGLTMTPLERDDFVLAVPSASALASAPGQCLALSEAAQENFILYPQQRVPSLHAMAHLRCQMSGFTPHVVQEAMQVHTILSLVASGIGVGLVAGVARQHAMPGVVCLELTDTPAQFCVGLAVAVAARQRENLADRVLQHVLKHHQTVEMAQRCQPA
ncbi:LysR family transcriptional regulator [Comamonas endophytica]|uniref:LysR substrate-binding domain-containing protein n=1 Tax=Comamonas endophytica TaxID=2949090 RepID=A0ABY6G918_9BURK|nr:MULTISPECIES: LysR family transcriptional regulator [unclassified Acidovorax]MCD2511831.1 LysR substrate-binding domain-containing protein [Acidovorax sp. D4N7]UYG51554.1 LysR substrate-binding domain-containing protein [Acidovorax sp. 5MLIR]